MKKILTVIMTLAMLFGCISFNAFAEETTEVSSVDVYVSIANKGTLEVTLEKVTVTDIDGDNALTINDALYAAHEAKYEGGAEAGYNSYLHEDYGLSLGKLWGDNSGNFGYYLNNVSAWSLADPISEGDFVNAFIYSDTDYYSDTYSWFDIASITIDENQDVLLTLSGAGYDADWNPISLPIENAAITINGEKTDYVTDAEGKVSIPFTADGTYVLSAVSDTQTLVPPVCVVTYETALTDDDNISNVIVTEVPATDDGNSDKNVSATETPVVTATPAANANTSGTTTAPKTADDSKVALYVAIVVSLGVVLTVSMKKKAYER